mgnify:CR=1 FL=1
MNKKDYKFLEDRLLELVSNDIISNEQYVNAKEYYHNKKENKSVSTIFGAIGIFLMALSIITLFAINWGNISKGIKVIISFIPLVITSIMLYICMAKSNKKMQLYTSIFAPIGIIATNSLIAQIFHIQTEIYELIFTSLIMFLPIAFILKNYISIIVYGIGTLIYAISVIDSSISENIALLKTFLISLPLIIYNIKNYISDREDGKNMVMWIINISLVTLFVFFKEIFRPDVFLIYLYMIYLITQTLFNKDNILNRILSLLFTGYLIISCITPFMVSYAEDIEFGFDTLLITILTAIFIYLSKSYKNPKEYFIFLFIFFLQYTRMDDELLFVFINIIAIAFGVYKIIMGNQKNSYKEIKKGVSVILLLILFRFVNSDISFMGKSIMFLIAGISFTIGANIMKKRIGGNQDE